MRYLLICSLVLCVAMPVLAGKETKDPGIPGEGTRGLLDCTGAVELVIDAAAVAGDNTGLVNNVWFYDCSVYKESGGEEVWYFTLTSETFVTITMVPDPTTTPDLDIYLLGSCDEIDCIDYSAGVSTEVITHCLDAGTYYVVVDGYGSTYPGAECPYTIESTSGDCPDMPDPVQGTDTCDAAPSLCDWLNDGVFYIQYDCTGFANDYNEDGNCGLWGSPGADMVYTVCLEAGGTIDITQTSTDGSSDLFLWMVTDCSDLTTCVAGSDNCCAGADEYFTYTSVAGGTYYIIVDSYTSHLSAYGTIYGTITGCCGGTATENTSWGKIKRIFR